MCNWKLIECDFSECSVDDSGIYTIINRVEKKGTHKEYSGVWVQVRIDVMQNGTDTPIVSFIGTAENVYKGFCKWLDSTFYALSSEHLMYIGFECAMAELKHDYKQR